MSSLPSKETFALLTQEERSIHLMGALGVQISHGRYTLRLCSSTPEWPFMFGLDTLQVQFFEDQGRFMRDSFHGYRALVTRSDRSQFWVDLPEAGAPSYIEVCLVIVDAFIRTLPWVSQ